MAAANASSSEDEYRGPGIMGLSPYVGDQILLTDTLLPGLGHPHWFRVTKLSERPDGRLELAGYPLARDDLGEIGIGEPAQVVVAHPAELIVRRPVDAPHLPPTPGQDPPPAPGPLMALFGVPDPTPLPPSIETALAHPDAVDPDDLWRPR
jgi:hypothetical protein